MLKKVLNKKEEAVGTRLEAICRQYSAHAYPKMRVADVLPIEGSGISDDEYGFALRAHFDFLVCNAEHVPLFAVEFDGPLHGSSEQVKRDETKDRLCVRFGLPIFRCRAAHLDENVDGWDLLSWIVDVWFMRDAAERMRERGDLPEDFDLDPALIVSAPGRTRKLPYWLGLNAQLRLERMCNQGRIVSHVPRIMYIGIDERDVWRGFAALEVSKGIGVRSTVSMRAQAFPVSLSEPMEGLLFRSLQIQVDAVLRGEQAGIAVSQLDEESRAVRRTTRMCSFLRSSDVAEEL